MAQTEARRKNSPKHKKVYPPSQTKFDVWLEQHLSSGEEVTFVFREDPLDLAKGKCARNVRILTVDRYFVYCEIKNEWANTYYKIGDSYQKISTEKLSEPEWHPVWVSKDNIISAQ